MSMNPPFPTNVVRLAQTGMIIFMWNVSSITPKMQMSLSFPSDSYKSDKS